MTTQPPPESAEPAPVATDTQDRECPLGVCCTGLGRVYCDCVCHNGPATPAPAGDAEVSHGEARSLIDQLQGRFGWYPRGPALYTYVAQQEARQQQAEREVDELRSTLQGKAEAIADLEADSRAALQGKDDAIAGLEHDCGRMHYLGNMIRQRTEAEQSELNALAKKHPPRLEPKPVVDKSARVAGAWKALARANGLAFRDAHVELNAAQRTAGTLKNERDELSRKLEAAEREVRGLRSAIAEGVAKLEETRWNPVGDIAEWAHATSDGANHSRVMSALDALRGLEASPAKPLTPDDVKGIARAVVAEVAERAVAKAGGSGNASELWELAKAAKEEL